LLGLFLVEDEAAVSGIINNMRATYVTISSSPKVVLHIVLRLKARIQKRVGSALNKKDQYHDSRINSFLMKNALI
jgi:hypothetical protein